jgi:hypothetical protein
VSVLQSDSRLYDCVLGLDRRMYPGSLLCVLDFTGFDSLDSFKPGNKGILEGTCPNVLKSIPRSFKTTHCCIFRFDDEI